MIDETFLLQEKKQDYAGYAVKHMLTSKKWPNGSLIYRMTSLNVFVCPMEIMEQF